MNRMFVIRVFSVKLISKRVKYGEASPTLSDWYPATYYPTWVITPSVFCQWSEDDFIAYAHWLTEYALQYQVIHAWVLWPIMYILTCNADDRGWYIENDCKHWGAAMSVISTTPTKEPAHCGKGDLNLCHQCWGILFYLPGDISELESR